MCTNFWLILLLQIQCLWSVCVICYEVKAVESLAGTIGQVLDVIPEESTTKFAINLGIIGKVLDQLLAKVLVLLPL